MNAENFAKMSIPAVLELCSLAASLGYLKEIQNIFDHYVPLSLDVSNAIKSDTKLMYGHNIHGNANFFFL